MFILSRGSANTALLVSVVFVAIGCKDRSSAPGTESAAAPATDDTTSAVVPGGKYKSAAEKVVTQIADVREGDLVVALGTADDLPFLEDIAVEARKRGADPLVTVGTERLARRMYDEVPARYDNQPPEMMLKIAGLADVFVFTESNEGRTLSGVAPERVA